MTESLSRRIALAEIEQRLERSGVTLQEAIGRRGLYFRVSVVGGCNLSCRFCHNEGAPLRGLLSLCAGESAVAAAARIGFTRVQFTGGEPLLRTDIGEFVAMARRYVADVGVTTNGTYLPRALEALVAAGVTRIHVSLQEESLVAAGSQEAWGVPDWLAASIEEAEQGSFSLRLNLPVQANSLELARKFLRCLRCGIKVFSVLPEGLSRNDEYPLAALEDLVVRANAERKSAGVPGEVVLRGYRPPSGIRCPACRDVGRCKEQSHSLRLGADLILRPCLATRAWDQPLDWADVDGSVRDSAVLALDYVWD